jgi:hypothetical protein
LEQHTAFTAFTVPLAKVDMTIFSSELKTLTETHPQSKNWTDPSNKNIKLTLQTFKHVFSKTSLISLLRATQSRAKVWVQLQKAQRPIDLIQDLEGLLSLDGGWQRFTHKNT